MPNTFQERHWDILLSRIKGEKCTPFLGAGLCAGVLPSRSEIAEEWAQEHNYPLEDSNDLARVARFLAVTYDDQTPKEKILERCKDAIPPSSKEPDEPHGVLADLPFPVYITTNYNDFMVQALKSRYRDPKQELCRWNDELVKNEPSVFEEPGFTPTPANPVVFHFLGHDKVEESLVLTEDDYLDFLINISKDPQLLPKRIQRAFGGTSLLFLGYQIVDWDFRILLRILVGYLKKNLGRAHVSVQLEPVGDKASEAQKEKVQEYLNKYFGKLDIQVYWGKCREFAAELRKRWEAFNRGH